MADQGILRPSQSANPSSIVANRTRAKKAEKGKGKAVDPAERAPPIPVKPAELIRPTLINAPYPDHSYLFDLDDRFFYHKGVADYPYTFDQEERRWIINGAPPEKRRQIYEAQTPNWKALEEEALRYQETFASKGSSEEDESIETTTKTKNQTQNLTGSHRPLPSTTQLHTLALNVPQSHLPLDPHTSNHSHSLQPYQHPLHHRLLRWEPVQKR